MPELKMCPECRLKHGVGLIYNPSMDTMDIDTQKLIYDTKFLCLKCDRIYENSRSLSEINPYDIAWDKVFKARSTP
jgi:hypothetical protein